MDQKNLFLAILISVVILVGSEYLFGAFGPKPPPPTAKPTHTAQTAKPAPAPTGGAPGALPSAQQSRSRAEALAAQARVKIDTPHLQGSIDLTGGVIDDLSLVDYHDTVNPKSPDVVLLEPVGTKDAYFAEFGWVAGAGEAKPKLPGPHTVWQASPGPLTPTHPVTLTWDNGAGLVFTRTIAIDQNYMFSLTDSVKNTGSAAVTLLPYALISRSGTPPVSGYYLLFEGPIGFLDGGLQEIKYASLAPTKSTDFKSTGGWLGFTDKYWLTALIPPQHEAIKAEFRKEVEGGIDRYQSDYLGAAVTVPAGGTAANSNRLFAGAKEVNLLDAYADSGIPRFDRAIDFGWFYFLTKPIFLVLVFFHRLLGNFGLAILLFTFIVKLLFFPLANKSYRAMSKMKLLQPEMQKLRERYPDDKAKQQQEIMALYKRVGANPLAGCLPIVIQIPVFFSLYKVLFVTIEMRHAPFFGWIHDLSAPDPTSFANLFGVIPWVPPHFLMIGAWPLIMGLSMFLQQKLNPQPVDPVQAKMFLALPIVFTYMLSSFPAGLVIYWAWNNSLSIAQQWVIMHRAGAA
ncbi:MAG TPA: membrane protein insertase YidC [Stellaceae bacterium]|nr:membrane protein insertase YidC [Stellaceae bacterium]